MKYIKTNGVDYCFSFPCSNLVIRIVFQTGVREFESFSLGSIDIGKTNCRAFPKAKTKALGTQSERMVPVADIEKTVAIL